MRSKIRLALCAIGVGFITTAGCQAQQAVIRGNARFQVLSSGVIRLEYSPARKFLNRASVAVLNRNWGPLDFKAGDSKGWLELSTAKMRIRYRLRSGRFDAANLLISWSDAQGDHLWKPGDKDDKNLGGVPGDIALRTVPGTEPGALSRNGYFVLDDSRTAVWNNAGDWVEPRADQNEQDWYFFVYGLDFKGLLRELAQLLGPIPMVPRYVFGSWFGSRAGYSAAEWKRIIHRFREERIPLDIVTLDSDSTAKVIWAGRDWDVEQMPDPAGFIKFANSQGVKVVVNEHYGALTPQNCSNFERIRTAMGLPPGTKLISHDLASKKYAELYMDILNKPALQAGLAFWWQDGNAQANMPGLDATLWTRHVEYTGAERITGHRAFDFERLDVPYQKTDATPAWGGHRYGGFFTGDLAAHWPTLNLLVPFNVQAGNMLLPYVINDNPGFTPQVIDTELYERSVQFNALSPVFWWHGIWGLRMPWEYGSDALQDARKFLELRYRLIPYLYTYSRLAHENGEPIVRGTYIEYPEQKGAYEFRQQYLLGKELLVAPISEPGFGKPSVKRVYLPEGEHWFDWFTGRIYNGGQVIAYECPLDRMPIFVKAGTIIPLAPPMQYSDEHPLDPLTLEIFAGRPASFRLYEDDGTSLEYRHHQYSWTEFTYASSNSGQQRIVIGAAQGHFNGQLAARSYVIRVHGLLKPVTVRLGDRTLPELQTWNAPEGWSWDGQNLVTKIRVAETPIQKQVELTLENAGSFADQTLLQGVVDYRSQVRQVEIAEKLKWGTLLGDQDIKKEPRVLRITQQVEQELDDLVDNRDTLSRKTPDFAGWTTSILEAFAHEPFESNRSIPETDADALASTRRIEGAIFTPEEIDLMTAQLLGCNLVAKATGHLSPEIVAKLQCSEIMPSAQISYAIEFPTGNPPGWSEVSRSIDEYEFIHIESQAPFPLEPRAYPIRVKAILKWNGGETERAREVQWMSSGDSGS